MSFLPILDYGVPPTATTSDGDGNYINSNPSGSDVSNTAATSAASAGGGNPPSRAKGATASGEGGTAGAGGAKADGAEQPKKKATKAGSSGAGGKKAAGKAAAKAEGKAEGKKTGKGKAGTGKGTGKAAGTGASTSAAGAAAAAREKEERMKAARAEVEAHAAALEAHRSAVFKLQALLIRDVYSSGTDIFNLGASSSSGSSGSGSSSSRSSTVTQDTGKPDTVTPPTVTPSFDVRASQLAAAGRLLSRSEYDAIVEERAIGGFCGNPLCNQVLQGRVALSLPEHRELLYKEDLQGVLDAAGVGKVGEVREWVGDKSMGERMEEEEEKGRDSASSADSSSANTTSTYTDSSSSSSSTTTTNSSSSNALSRPLQLKEITPGGADAGGTGAGGTGGADAGGASAGADGAAAEALCPSEGFQSAVHDAIEGYVPRHGTETLNIGYVSRGERGETRGGDGGRERAGERRGGQGKGESIAQSIMSQVVAGSGTCDEVFAANVGMDGWVGGEQENDRGGMGVGVGDGGTIDAAPAAEAGEVGGAGAGAAGSGTGTGPAEVATGKAEAQGATVTAAEAEGRTAELRPALKKAVHGEKGGRAVGMPREEGRHVTWAADDRLAVAQTEGRGGRGREGAGGGEQEPGSAGQEERRGEGSVAGERGGMKRGGGRGKKQGAVREGAVREGSSGVVDRSEDGVEGRVGWGVEGGAEAAAAGRCGWFEPPPPGFMMQLPFHCTLLMALQEWVTADSLCLIYPPQPPAPSAPQQPAAQQSPCVESSLEANGWEYPALLGSVNDPARAAEIRRTLGDGLGRETAGVAESLGLLLPLSTVEHALTRLLATFAFRSPLASLRHPHWQLLLLLLLEALSVNCLPPAASDALNTHRHQVYKVGAAAGVDRDNYLLLRQMLLPRGPSVSNPNQNTNAAA
ncbi:unnamed protein product [Closterium sp. NIES-54]